MVNVDVYGMLLYHNERIMTGGDVMRIVVTGANGQLGRAVVAQLQPHYDVVGLGHAEIELSQPATADGIAALRPAVIIHAAAMTSVDGCALDPDTAYRINALGTRWVAQAARRSNARMVVIVPTKYLMVLPPTPMLNTISPTRLTPMPAPNTPVSSQPAKSLTDSMWCAWPGCLGANGTLSVPCCV
jgi:nucleoside-diphosphate-sugar epimerase